MSPLDEVDGFCKKCGEIREFEYIGTQDAEPGQPSIELYNCKVCSSSVSLKSLRESMKSGVAK